MGRTVNSCAICKHSMFDDKWGDYKCMKSQRRILNIYDYSSCKSYRKDPEKIKKK